MQLRVIIAQNQIKAYKPIRSLAIMKPERLETLDVMRKEGDRIYVLGNTPTFSWSIINDKCLFYTVHDASTGKIIEEDSFGSISGEDISRCVGLSFLGIGIPFLIYGLAGKGARERRIKTKEFYKNVEKFQEANLSDLGEAVKDINVYQGNISDVSQELGIGLERVETGKPTKFITDEDTFGLRVKALCLGANAVVNYQPGSATGTPVKYKK